MHRQIKIIYGIFFFQATEGFCCISTDGGSALSLLKWIRSWLISVTGAASQQQMDLCNLQFFPSSAKSFLVQVEGVIHIPLIFSTMGPKKIQELVKPYESS